MLNPPRSKPKCQTSHGFTLIEILVVIAIIGLLAAIIFPVLSRVRENARRASCQSNLKQIGLGMLLYSQDFDDALVQANYSGGGATASTPTTPNCQPNGSNVVSYRWMDAIFPYVKVESLFNCPSTIPKTVQPYHYCGGTDNGTGLKNTGATVWGSYGINYAYRGGIPFSNGVGAVGPSFLNLKMSAVEAASETVWVADGVGSGSVNSANFNWACILTDSTTPPAISTTDPRTLAAMLAERHLNTADVLYMDGHVKAVSLDTLAATKTYTKSGHTYTNVATAFTIAAD